MSRFQRDHYIRVVVEMATVDPAGSVLACSECDAGYRAWGLPAGFAPPTGMRPLEYACPQCWAEAAADTWKGILRPRRKSRVPEPSRR